MHVGFPISSSDPLKNKHLILHAVNTTEVNFAHPASTGPTARAGEVAKRRVFFWGGGEGEGGGEAADNLPPMHN